MRPIEIFNLNIKRSRALIGTHQQLHNKRGKPLMVVSDIMRASVVMAVSAFDAYLHGVAREYVLRSAQLASPPEALLALIREWKLEPSAQLQFMLQRKGPADLAALVERHFSDRTLQDPAKVDQVGRMLGIGSVWTEVATSLGKQEPDVKASFAAIVMRRHRIAHEADIDPGGKTAFKKRALTRPATENCIDEIEAVAQAIQGILDARYP